MIRSLALAVLLATASGCSQPRDAPTRADQAAAEQILRRGNGNDPDSLDPHLATSVNAGNVLFNLFEGLTRLHPETLEPEPAMAKRWEISPDGLTYVFEIRDAHWSNGDPVTAKDFVFAWRRILHPDLAANYAYMVFPIQGAEAIHQGLQDMETLGATALPDGRLELRLERPVPHLLSLLAHWTWFPLHAPSMLSIGDKTDRTAPWTRPEVMVVNGPFVLERWRPGNDLAIRKNPRYWQAEEVRLQGAEFLPIMDPATEERAFRAGEIHLTYSFPRQRLPAYRSSNQLRIDPYLQSNAWVLNLNRPPLDDVRIRRALSKALDRRVIVENVLGGLRNPAYSYVPPGKPLLTEDAEGAARLLAEAGYPSGEGLREFEMILPNARDWVRVAEVLQAQWQRVGIRVRINSMERGTYFSRRSEGKFDLCFLGWVGDYPDPETFLGLWQSTAGNNFAGWENPEYDQLLEASARPGADRPAIQARAEEILMRELPLIPVAFGTTVYLQDPRLRNWHANLLDHHPLRVVWFDSDPQ